MKRARSARRQAESSPALIVALAVALDLGAAILLFQVKLPGGVVLPGWTAVMVPLAAYALIALGALRRAAVAERVAGALGLCAGHATLSLVNASLYWILGPLSFGSALAHAVWGSPVVHLLQLVWTPLALLPFRGLLLPHAPRPRDRTAALRTVTTRITGPRAPRGVPAKPAADPARAPLPAERKEDELTAAEVRPSPAQAEEAAEAPLGAPGTPEASRVSTNEAAPAATPVIRLEESSEVPDSAIAQGLTAPIAVEVTDAAPSPVRTPLGAPTAATVEVRGEEFAARAPERLEAERVQAEPGAAPAPERPITVTTTISPPAVAEREKAVGERDGAALPALPAEVPVPAGPGHTIELRQVATVFAPFAPMLSASDPLEIDAQAVDDITLFTVFPPRAAKETLIRVAARCLPALAGGGSLESGPRVGPIDQLTLRGSRGSVVLTPLGSGDRRPALCPVLVTGARRRGCLALLEVLSSRVAAEYRAAHPDASGTVARAAGRERAAPDLRAATVPKQIERLAEGLQAFGPVLSSAFRDASEEGMVYLFLPVGTAAQALGELACGLYHSVKRDAGSGGIGVLESIVIRLQDRRVVVRLVSVTAASSTLVVAGGRDVGRAGLAHLQVERAAARLAALG